jgi:hypothetical protein
LGPGGSQLSLGTGSINPGTTNYPICAIRPVSTWAWPTCPYIPSLSQPFPHSPRLDWNTSCTQVRAIHLPAILIHTMSTQFLSLPNDLLILILSFLPYRSIPACKHTCRRLRSVIMHSLELRCRIHTLESYMEDLSPPDLSTADFLHNLGKWENAWLTFSVGRGTPIRSMSWPFQAFSEFLLRSGYLIQVCPIEAPGWSYVDLSAQCDINGRGRPTAQWKVIKLALVFTTKWALDIDQGLVAVSYLA